MSAAVTTRSRAVVGSARVAGSAGQPTPAVALPAPDRRIPRGEAGQTLSPPEDGRRRSTSRRTPPPASNTGCAAPAATEAREGVPPNSAVPSAPTAPAPVRPASGALSRKRAPYRGWTTTEVRRLAELRQQGRTIEQMAAALGRSINSIKGQIYASQIRPKERRRYTRWTGEEIAEARRLIADGLSRRDVAAHLGRTLNGLHLALRVRGGPVGRPRKQVAP